jgi:hypothetical protein
VEVLVVQIGLWVALSGSVVPFQPREAPAPLETNVKATFVYQFTRFAEWPAQAWPPEGAPRFNMCVVANDTFEDTLDRILIGETAAGRPLARVVPETPQEARTCHVLYLSGLDADQVRSWLDGVAGRPVLTVSDAADFLSLGGQILLVRDDNRVRFDVDLGAVRRHGVVLRSQLLRLARRVLTSADSQP